MKRLLLICAWLAIYAGCLAQRTFNHPGALLTNTEIETMKRHIAAGEEPWLSEWNAMVSAYGAANYTAAANTEIGGSKGNRQRACRDAKAAFYNTIIWRIRGTEANALCAVRILSAWGNKCTSAKEQLFQFPCLDMCTSAEFLRNEDGSFYSGWSESDRANFMKMVRDVFVPALRGQSGNGLPSWSAPATAAMMAAGILLDDSAIYEETLGYVMDESSTKSTSIYKAFRDGGQVWEMGRDNVHAMLSVGDIVQMAQMAWNQGDDLYAAGGDRILSGVDYWCRYNSNHPTAWTTVPSAENGNYHWYYVSMHDNGFRLRPDGTNFEAVYHHYKEVLGVDESRYPYLSFYTKVARPERDYGTLLYAADIETSPLFTVKPAKPENVRAEDCKSYIDVSWRHPSTEDQRDYFVYRSTDGQIWSEVAHLDYNTNNHFYDTGIKEGVTYYYKVRLRNYGGMGPESDICQCTVGKGTATMPDGWAVASVSGKMPATATYSHAAHNSFQLRGGGREIYYGDDGCAFLYYTFTGDGSITMRMTGCNGYQNGLMMRKSLNSGSVMAAVTFGGKNGRNLDMWNRVNQGDGKPTMLLGSDYTHTGAWMRLERKENLFTSYVSSDGKDWKQVASQTLAFGTQPYYAGIFVCNDKNTSGGERYINVDHVSIANGSQQLAAAPDGLTATAVNSARVRLRWNVAVGAENYTILRKTTGSDGYEVLANLDSITTFDDSLLTAQITYEYAVVSENWSGTSQDTATVAVTTPALACPVLPELKAGQNGLTSALITWNHVDEAAYYAVLRKDSADGVFTTVADSVSKITFTDKGLEQNHTYYYKVLAFNDAGQAESNTIRTEIRKCVKIGSTITATDNILSMDYGRELRGRARFFEVKAVNDAAYMLKNSLVQVARTVSFEDPVTIGGIDRTASNGFTTGFPVATTDSVYRHFRIVASNGMTLSKSDFTVSVYGDTVVLRRQSISLPSNLIYMTPGDEDIDIAANATSGLTCIYTSGNEDVATIVDGRVHAVAVGRARITVSQPGDDVWGEALSRTCWIVVSETTGIKEVSTRPVKPIGAYTLEGRSASMTDRKGIYIIKYSDGTTKKVIRK